MQSLSWYVRRLRSMSPGEIAWRVRNKVCQAIDRPLAPLRRRPLPLAKIARNGASQGVVRPEAIGRDVPPVGAAGDAIPAFAQWKFALLARAERITHNRLTLFDLEDHDLGPQIDWNYEYKARIKTPMLFAPQVDYRDYQETGDCKFVWEPSRHYHLVTLGRAYRVSGDRAFAQAVLDHIESWMEQCPYGFGMNWRSPLELAIRMINWVWALELIRPSGLITPPKVAPLLGCVYRHLWDISRSYSRYSSANNHLIGEAAGVFIASSYFEALADAPRWRQRSRQILLREIARQTYADGGNREQAYGYHLFVLEFLLLAGLVARNRSEDFPPEYWNTLERMFEFLCALLEGGEHAPMYGDADDGYVLDLAGGRPQPRELMAVGAALFDRGDFKAEARNFSEQTFWLLGRPGYERFTRIALPDAPAPIAPRSLAASGYYLLQTGHRGSADRVSVSFDCGDLGLGSIAAHGHADALSFTLRVAGQDILVDPGTYDYFTYGPWRNYFRSTRAHNTIVIDDRDQSEMLGSFLWGRRAQARCTRYAPSGAALVVSGEHDGYASLPGGVIHRRTLAFDPQQQTLTITDELTGEGDHSAAWYFHLAEGCTLIRGEGQPCTLKAGGVEVSIAWAPEMAVQVLAGSDDPMGGWVSRGYHRKTASTTLIARRNWKDHQLTVTTLRIVSTASQ